MIIILINIEPAFATMICEGGILMSYDINAWLEDGQPRLQIIDADSGAVRLAWQYRRPDPAPSEAEQYLQQMAVKALFQELFLLSSLRAVHAGRTPMRSKAPPDCPGGSVPAR